MSQKNKLLYRELITVKKVSGISAVYTDAFMTKVTFIFDFYTEWFHSNNCVWPTPPFWNDSRWILISPSKELLIAERWERQSSVWRENFGQGSILGESFKQRWLLSRLRLFHDGAKAGRVIEVDMTSVWKFSHHASIFDLHPLVLSE